MKYFIIDIIVLIAVITIVYLTFCYICITFNPLEFSKVWRVFFAISNLSLITTFVLNIISNSKE